MRAALTAAAGRDKPKQDALYQEFQRMLIDQANLIVLVQPVYRVAHRRQIQDFRLTGAGWMAELGAAKPA